MSAFNNNETFNNNTTTSGIEGRASNLDSTGLYSQRNNLEDAYNRRQAVGQLGAESGFESATQRNNLEDAYNRRQEPLDLLNENHGIAASSLNDAHTHSAIPATHGVNDNLDYSGAPIADTRKVDQDTTTSAFPSHTIGSNTTSSTNNNPFNNNNTSSIIGPYSSTAGQDLNSQTNRHAGTGIPPVNTAEHVRRNAAEEAIDGGNKRFDTEQNSYVSDLPTGRSAADKNTSTYNTGSAANTAAATASATALSGDHGASHRHKNQGGDLGLEDKARLNSQIQHDVNATSETHGTDGERHAGVPQHEGLLPKHSYHNDRDIDNNNEGLNKHSSHDDVDADGKPSAGDKIKGKVEKIVGKVTGNEEKVIKGEERAQGRD